MLAPGQTRKVTAEHIDGTPTVDAGAKLFDILFGQACESWRVLVYQLIRNESMRYGGVVA